MDSYGALARLASTPADDDLAFSALPGAPVRRARGRRRRPWTRRDNPARPVDEVDR
jgi:hypothetical protein